MTDEEWQEFHGTPEYYELVDLVERQLNAVGAVGYDGSYLDIKVRALIESRPNEYKPKYLG